MSVAMYEERTPLLSLVKFQVADGTALKTIATGSMAGIRFDDILMTNDGAADHVVELVLGSPAVDYLLGSINVPAGTGKAGTPPLSAAATLAPANQAGWPLVYSQTFKARVVVAMGAAENLDILAFGGAF